MQNSFKLLIIVLCLSVFSFKIDDSQARKEKEAFERGLILLAGTSMTNVLHDALKDFSQQRNISISTTFSSTEELANSIEDGEPANIFISEDPKKMRDLQRKGVLNVFSLSTLVTDKLVIVMGKEHYLSEKVKKYKTVRDKLRFLMDNSIMAITDPRSDPAGMFITQALEVMDLKDDSDKKTVKTDNNRRSLYMAANSNNTAIVYASDAHQQDDVVVLAEIPQKYYDRIVYQIAIVAEISSESNVKDSEALVEYLKSDKMTAMFQRYGFGKM